MIRARTRSRRWTSCCADVVCDADGHRSRPVRPVRVALADMDRDRDVDRDRDRDRGVPEDWIEHRRDDGELLGWYQWSAGFAPGSYSSDDTVFFSDMNEKFVCLERDGSKPNPLKDCMQMLYGD